MEGESSGVQQAQGQVEQGENQRQDGQEPGVDAQSGQKQDQQEPQKDAVSGGDTDYAAQLKAKDAEIEALISWLCAKRWCQHHGKGVRPPPRIFSYHTETIGDSHKDTVAHEAPAMPPRTCRPPTRAPSTSGGWPTGWCWCSLRSGPSDHWEMSTVSTKN